MIELRAHALTYRAELAVSPLMRAPRSGLAGALAEAGRERKGLVLDEPVVGRLIGLVEGIGFALDSLCTSASGSAVADGR